MRSGQFLVSPAGDGGRGAAAALAVLVLSGSAASLVPAEAASDLKASLDAIIARSGAEVAVAFRTLDGRQELFLRADDTFHAASTMKVPVMIELFRQAEAGTLRLDDLLPVTNRFHSIVDGSEYALSAEEDS